MTNAVFLRGDVLPHY